MFKIKYTKKAEDKLYSIYSFIAQDNSYVAAKVIMKIKESVEILQMFPYSWIKLEGDYRFIVDWNYKYKIVYKILNKTIFIISIFKYENSWE